MGVLEDAASHGVSLTSSSSSLDGFLVKFRVTLKVAGRYTNTKVFFRGGYGGVETYTRG